MVGNNERAFNVQHSGVGVDGITLPGEDFHPVQVAVQRHRSPGQGQGSGIHAAIGRGIRKVHPAGTRIDLPLIVQGAHRAGIDRRGAEGSVVPIANGCVGRIGSNRNRAFDLQCGSSRIHRITNAGKYLRPVLHPVQTGHVADDERIGGGIAVGRTIANVHPARTAVQLPIVIDGAVPGVGSRHRKGGSIAGTLRHICRVGSERDGAFHRDGNVAHHGVGVYLTIEGVNDRHQGVVQAGGWDHSNGITTEEVGQGVHIGAIGIHHFVRHPASIDGHHQVGGITRISCTNGIVASQVIQIRCFNVNGITRVTEV